MTKFVVSIWDGLDIIEPEDAEELEAQMKCVLSVVAHDEPTAEKCRITLENLISVSDDPDIQEYWIVTVDELVEPQPGDMKALADIFHEIEKKAMSK